MAFCTNCGKQVADGVKFCTSCGTLVASYIPPAPPPAQTAPPQAAPVPQQPVYAVPVTVRQEEPISTGEYIGIFLLMIVPLVNLICLLIWACGGCKKVNKRNLARAMLVLILIVTVLTGLLVLAGGLLFGDMLNELKELSTQLEGISTQ